MSELDKIGLISNEDGCYWGSRRRYPTREDFAEAVELETGEPVTRENVREIYMRRSRPVSSEYDISWHICDGPARGATASWEYDYQ